MKASSWTRQSLHTGVIPSNAMVRDYVDQTDGEVAWLTANHQISNLLNSQTKIPDKTRLLSSLRLRKRKMGMNNQKKNVIVQMLSQSAIMGKDSLWAGTTKMRQKCLKPAGIGKNITLSAASMCQWWFKNKIDFPTKEISLLLSGKEDPKGISMWSVPQQAGMCH